MGGLSDADMWAHRKNVEVSIHPVTGEVLFPMGRMSAFVPMNVPLCALMLMAQTPGQVVFTQWLNQTYNVVNNYVNRSGATVARTFRSLGWKNGVERVFPFAIATARISGCLWR